MCASRHASHMYAHAHVTSKRTCTYKGNDEPVSEHYRFGRRETIISRPIIRHQRPMQDGKKYKLLAMDLDKTLLGTDGSIPGEVIDRLRELSSEGVHQCRRIAAGME